MGLGEPESGHGVGPIGTLHVIFSSKSQELGELKYTYYDYFIINIVCAASACASPGSYAPISSVCLALADYKAKLKWQTDVERRRSGREKTAAMGKTAIAGWRHGVDSGRSECSFSIMY